MIVIHIPNDEYFDSDTQTFINYPEEYIKLEHSLVSVSRWESKYNKPFLGSLEKTNDEMYYYIKCMIIDENYDISMLRIKSIPKYEIEKINSYITSPMTATTIRNNGTKSNKEIITSELIYYWMIAFTIPFECQKWHLNRLITLINVCNAKNATPKKQNQKEILSNNAALNAARKKAMNTTG